MIFAVFDIYNCREIIYQSVILCNICKWHQFWLIALRIFYPVTSGSGIARTKINAQHMICLFHCMHLEFDRLIDNFTSQGFTGNFQYAEVELCFILKCGKINIFFLNYNQMHFFFGDNFTDCNDIFQVIVHNQYIIVANVLYCTLYFEIAVYSDWHAFIYCWSFELHFAINIFFQFSAMFI